MYKIDAAIIKVFAFFDVLEEAVDQQMLQYLHGLNISFLDSYLHLHLYQQHEEPGYLYKILHMKDL